MNVPMYILVRPSPGTVSTNDFYPVESVPGDSFTSIATSLYIHTREAIPGDSFHRVETINGNCPRGWLPAGI